MGKPISDWPIANLQLHHPKPALLNWMPRRRFWGNRIPGISPGPKAFRQEQDFPHAETEYQTALAEDPNDLYDANWHMPTCSIACAGIADAIAALNTAMNLSPSDPSIYAYLAQVHAKQGERDQALQEIESAEKLGGNRVEILTATGDALLTLGDRDGAMQRFSRALDVPGGDRIGVRLSIAEIFLRQGHFDEAHRQIALGFAEARISPDSPVTGEDFARLQIFSSRCTTLIWLKHISVRHSFPALISRNRRTRAYEHLSGRRQHWQSGKRTGKTWARD